MDRENWRNLFEEPDPSSLRTLRFPTLVPTYTQKKNNKRPHSEGQTLANLNIPSLLN